MSITADKTKKTKNEQGQKIALVKIKRGKAGKLILAYKLSQNLTDLFQQNRRAGDRQQLNSHLKNFLESNECYIGERTELLTNGNLNFSLFVPDSEEKKAKQVTREMPITTRETAKTFLEKSGEIFRKLEKNFIAPFELELSIKRTEVF